MEKNIIVGCQSGDMTIAILEDKEVVELFIERETDEKFVGNIYSGIVEQVKVGLEAAFVDVGLDKSVYLSFKDVVRKERNKELKKGDRILIQITKEPISTKCFRGSMDVSLPGRYLVYMPFNNYIGISKNIKDRLERQRLKDLFKDFKKNCTGGFIVRTEAEGSSKEVLKREIDYLLPLWKNIEETFSKAKPRSIVHEDLGLIFKIVRDKLSSDVKSFLIDSLKEYKQVISFVSMISKTYKDKVLYYKPKIPILKAYGIDEVMSNIMKQKIYLKSGGYIIIQEAESLCAIDVNTGRTKGKNLEEVSLKTNLEAVHEIATQLRLRNIGGIIVNDFVDMYKKNHREQVLRKLQEETKYDKAKIKILPITALGLIEMTRERRSESMASFLSSVCPACRGSGRILSPETLYTRLKRRFKETKNKKLNIKVTLNPLFSNYFTNKKREELTGLTDSVIRFKFDHRILAGDYEMVMENQTDKKKHIAKHNDKMAK